MLRCDALESGIRQTHEVRIEVREQVFRQRFSQRDQVMAPRMFPCHLDGRASGVLEFAFGRAHGLACRMSSICDRVFHMTLTLTIDLPPELERALQASSGETNRTAREALALSLFREGRLAHADLGRALGLDRFETDALLKRNQVASGGLTLADLEADRATLDKILGPARR
jgi:hypothetical protein